MAYSRDSSLEQRRQHLLEQLSTARNALHARGELEARVQRLESELRELREEVPKLTSLPGKLRLSVASPCREDWSAMNGNERVRHCARCDKNVYNLSSMDEAAIVELLSRSGEKPCVRFYQRRDGTVLTADCPVGRRKKRVVLTVLGAAAAVGVGAAAWTAYDVMTTVVVMGALPAHPVQGELSVDEPPPPAVPEPTE